MAQGADVTGFNRAIAATFIKGASTRIDIDNIKTNCTKPLIARRTRHRIQKRGTDTLPARLWSNEDTIHQQNVIDKGALKQLQQYATP